MKREIEALDKSLPVLWGMYMAQVVANGTNNGTKGIYERILNEDAMDSEAATPLQMSLHEKEVQSIGEITRHIR